MKFDISLMRLFVAASATLVSGTSTLDEEDEAWIQDLSENGLNDAITTSAPSLMSVRDLKRARRITASGAKTCGFITYDDDGTINAVPLTCDVGTCATSISSPFELSHVGCCPPGNDMKGCTFITSCVDKADATDVPNTSVLTCPISSPCNSYYWVEHSIVSFGCGHPSLATSDTITTIHHVFEDATDITMTSTTSTLGQGDTATVPPGTLGPPLDTTGITSRPGPTVTGGGEPSAAPQPGRSGPLSQGAKIAIGTTCGVVLLGVSGVTVFCCRVSRRKRRMRRANQYYNGPGTGGSGVEEVKVQIKG